MVRKNNSCSESEKSESFCAAIFCICLQRKAQESVNLSGKYLYSCPFRLSPNYISSSARKELRE